MLRVVGTRETGADQLRLAPRPADAAGAGGQELGQVGRVAVADLLADGTGLYLRYLALRRLAAAGLGRGAGADFDRTGDGTRRKMGNAGVGARGELIYAG